jgi:hypothetical protein
MTFTTKLLTAGTLGLLASSAHALTINLDYGHDTATDNFFGSNATAKAALEKARDDIQNAITSVLGAMSTDTVIGVNGSTSAHYNFALNYTNPSTGAAQSIPISTMGLDQMTVFVGMRELTGATLGQGGPGSTGLGVGVGGGAVPAEWPGATANANGLATTQRLRGAGPVINTLSGSASLGGTPGAVNVSYGSAVSNLWFDIDTDNDTAADNAAQMAAFWHFDANTAVAPGKADFYSVALHELLHALGVGTSQTWVSQISGGTNWTGTEVITLLGSGNGVIDSGGGHIASGLTSPRLSDGLLQETVMSPSITLGTRKTFTQLDLAFLRDINWSTIPEPSGAALLLMAAFGVSRRRR